MLVDVLISFLSDLIGVRTLTLKPLFEKALLLKQDKKNADLLADKIEELTFSLRKSSELMFEIENEFAKQKEMADIWKEQATTSQIITSLNQEEVAAVTKIFGSQIKRDSKKSSRWALLWNVILCLIGLVGGYFISKYLLK